MIGDILTFNKNKICIKKTEFPSHFGGNIFGDRGLDPGSRDRETKSGNRSDQLINSQCFCTNGPGEEYPIEETYNSCKNSGYSQ